MKYQLIKLSILLALVVAQTATAMDSSTFYYNAISHLQAINWQEQGIAFVAPAEYTFENGAAYIFENGQLTESPEHLATGFGILVHSLNDPRSRAILAAAFEYGKGVGKNADLAQQLLIGVDAGYWKYIETIFKPQLQDAATQTDKTVPPWKTKKRKKVSTSPFAIKAEKSPSENPVVVEMEPTPGIQDTTPPMETVEQEVDTTQTIAVDTQANSEIDAAIKTTPEPVESKPTYADMARRAPQKTAQTATQVQAEPAVPVVKKQKAIPEASVQKRDNKPKRKTRRRKPKRKPKKTITVETAVVQPDAPIQKVEIAPEAVGIIAEPAAEVQATTPQPEPEIQHTEGINESVPAHATEKMETQQTDHIAGKNEAPGDPRFANINSFGVQDAKEYVDLALEFPDIFVQVEQRLKNLIPTKKKNKKSAAAKQNIQNITQDLNLQLARLYLATQDYVNLQATLVNAGAYENNLPVDQRLTFLGKIIDSGIYHMILETNPLTDQCKSYLSQWHHWAATTKTSPLLGLDHNVEGAKAIEYLESITDPGIKEIVKEALINLYHNQAEELLKSDETSSDSQQQVIELCNKSLELSLVNISLRLWLNKIASNNLSAANYTNAMELSCWATHRLNEIRFSGIEEKQERILLLFQHHIRCADALVMQLENAYTPEELDPVIQHLRDAVRLLLINPHLRVFADTIGGNRTEIYAKYTTLLGENEQTEQLLQLQTLLGFVIAMELKANEGHTHHEQGIILLQEIYNNYPAAQMALGAALLYKKETFQEGADLCLEGYAKVLSKENATAFECEITDLQMQRCVIQGMPESAAWIVDTILAGNIDLVIKQNKKMMQILLRKQKASVDPRNAYHYNLVLNNQDVVRAITEYAQQDPHAWNLIAQIQIMYGTYTLQAVHNDILSPELADQAKQYIITGITNHLKNPEYREWVGQACYIMGVMRWKLKEPEFCKSLLIQGKLLGNPGAYAQFAGMAADHERDSNKKEAILLKAREYAQAHQDDTAAWCLTVRLSRAAIDIGNYEKAIKWIMQVPTDLDQGIYHQSIAERLYKIEQYGHAITIFEELSKINSNAEKMVDACRAKLKKRLKKQKNRNKTSEAQLVFKQASAQPTPRALEPYEELLHKMVILQNLTNTIQKDDPKHNKLFERLIDVYKQLINRYKETLTTIPEVNREAYRTHIYTIFGAAIDYLHQLELDNFDAYQKAQLWLVLTNFYLFTGNYPYASTILEEFLKIDETERNQAIMEYGKDVAATTNMLRQEFLTTIAKAISMAPNSDEENNLHDLLQKFTHSDGPSSDGEEQA